MKLRKGYIIEFNRILQLKIATDQLGITCQKCLHCSPYNSQLAEWNVSHTKYPERREFMSNVKCYIDKRGGTHIESPIYYCVMLFVWRKLGYLEHFEQTYLLTYVIET